MNRFASVAEDERARGAALLALSVLGTAWLLLTPGFFSHDELTLGADAQRSVWLQGFGLEAARHDAFWRPLSTWLEASAFAIGPLPLAPHALLVGLHALATWSAWRVGRTLLPRAAFLGALLFALSPNAAYAVGWVAAIHDVAFTLLGLASLGAAIAWWRGGGAWSLAASVAAMGLALMCKETALVLPAASLLAGACDRRRAGWPRVLALVAALGVLALLYLAVRLPALAALAESGVGGYGLKLWRTLRNLLTYLAFPFAPNAPELSAMRAHPKTMAWAVAIHLALIASLWRGRAMAVYLAAYLIPLLPVLALAKHETQYLYATALPLGFLLAVLLDAGGWRRALAALAAALSLWHGLSMQRAMHEAGRCQSLILVDVDSILAASPAARAAPFVAAEPGARSDVLARALFLHKVELDGATVSPTPAEPDQAATMRLTRSCAVEPVP